MLMSLLKNAEVRGSIQDAGIAKQLTAEQVITLSAQAEKVERERLRLALLLQEYGLDPDGVYQITPEGLAVVQ